MVTYPSYRKKVEADDTTLFYFESEGNVGKLKANNTEYIYNGKYRGSQSDQQLANQSTEISEVEWSAGVEDNATLPQRVGSTPIIRAH